MKKVKVKKCKSEKGESEKGESEKCKSKKTHMLPFVVAREQTSDCIENQGEILDEVSHSNGLETAGKG